MALEGMIARVGRMPRRWHNGCQGRVDLRRPRRLEMPLPMHADHGTHGKAKIDQGGRGGPAGLMRAQELAPIPIQPAILLQDFRLPCRPQHGCLSQAIDFTLEDLTGTIRVATHVRGLLWLFLLPPRLQQCGQAKLGAERRGPPGIAEGCLTEGDQQRVIAGYLRGIGVAR